MAPNFETDLLVITCASGKQSAHLPLVTKQWKRLRLIVNSASSQERLQNAYPYAEVIKSDLTSLLECNKAVEGASSIYYIGPPVHPRESAMGLNMIDAAQRLSKPPHFVFSSVLNSQLQKLLNHDCKRYVEEHLIESGLPYTILQPCTFMDNFPFEMLAKQAEGKGRGEEIVFPVMWDPKIQFSFLALRDLALAGKTVLEEKERHFLAKYDLCSTRPMSTARVCEIASEVLDRKVLPSQKSYEEAVQGFVKMQFDAGGGEADVWSEGRKDIIERLILYYNRHGFQGNPNVLEWLVGREATNHRDWMNSKLKGTNVDTGNRTLEITLKQA
jgi:uncharacterized protein YbjT (DUF2867 family)